MDGFLVVDKPAGITSHDVVGRLRRVLGTRRIGHAGTLDPSATGLLLVGVGRSTRLLRFAEAERKIYRGSVRFGSATTTLDAEGEVTQRADCSGLTVGRVDAALPGFRGEIEQVPPMVSAIKIGGEPLHAKARRGEEIERPTRRITIFRLALVGFDPGPEPLAHLEIECSAGTYIRTLADDLGRAVGGVAHLASLRRTGIGAWREHDAIALEDIDASSLRPIEHTVASLPRVQVDDATELALRQGKTITTTGRAGAWAAIGPHGIVAVCEDRGGVGRVLVGIPAREDDQAPGEGSPDPD